MSNEINPNTRVDAADTPDASATIPTLRVVTEHDSDSPNDSPAEVGASRDGDAVLTRAESYDSSPPESEVTTPVHPQLPDTTNVADKTPDLGAEVQAQLSSNLIATGELEKRASQMGLGMGGGIKEWKRLTRDIVWDTDGLRDDEDDGPEMTPEEEAEYRVMARAKAMAKLMGTSTSSNSKQLAAVVEEPEPETEPETNSAT